MKKSIRFRNPSQRIVPTLVLHPATPPLCQSDEQASKKYDPIVFKEQAIVSHKANQDEFNESIKIMRVRWLEHALLFKLQVEIREIFVQSSVTLQIFPVQLYCVYKVSESFFLP